MSGNPWPVLKTASWSRNWAMTMTATRRCERESWLPPARNCSTKTPMRSLTLCCCGSAMTMAISSMPR